MTYQWKIPLSVSAADAEKELARIAELNGGVVDPQAVVNESRSEDAPLHKLFEWDDTIAAEKYRISQARFIIRNITVQEEEETPVRQFVHASSQGYVTIHTAMRDEEMRDALLTQALNDMETFRAKYRALTALAEVIDAMETAEGAIKAGGAA